MITSRWVNVIFSIGLLALIIPFCNTYKDQIRTMSISYTQGMQSWTSNFWYPWFWIFAHPFYVIIKIGVTLVLFYLREKNSALKIFVLAQFSLSITEIIKLAARDSRPCFDMESISVFGGCSCSYGMTSGHSSESLLFYLLIYTELLSKVCQSLTLKVISIFSMLFIIFNIALSRIYFGAHYLDQVLIGLAFGYLVFSLSYLFETQLNNGMQSVLEFDIRKKNTKFISCVAIIISFTLTILVSWILWKRRTNDIDLPTIISSCKERCTQNGVSLADRHLVTLAGANTPFAFFIILMFSNQGNTLTNLFYYSDTLRCSSKALIRLVVFIIIASPIIIGEILALFLKAWVTNISRLALSFVFALIFVIDLKKLLIFFKCDVKGDFFIDNGFDILEATGSDFELVGTLTSELNSGKEKAGWIGN